MDDEEFWQKYRCRRRCASAGTDGARRGEREEVFGLGVNGARNMTNC